MVSYEKFRKDLLSNPSARKGYEKYRPSIMCGELVRKWRTEAGMTQVQLAAKIGTTQEAISRIESADGVRGPHAGTLAVIADACGREMEITAEKRIAKQAVTEETLNRNVITVSFADLDNDDAVSDLNQLQARLAKLSPSKEMPHLEYVASITGVLTALLIPFATSSVSSTFAKELTEWIQKRNRPVRIKSEYTVIESSGKDSKAIMLDLFDIFQCSSEASTEAVAKDV